MPDSGFTVRPAQPAGPPGWNLLPARRPTQVSRFKDSFKWEVSSLKLLHTLHFISPYTWHSVPLATPLFATSNFPSYSTTTTVLLGSPSPDLLTAITRNSNSLPRGWDRHLYRPRDHLSRVGGSLHYRGTSLSCKGVGLLCLGASPLCLKASSLALSLGKPAPSERRPTARSSTYALQKEKVCSASGQACSAVEKVRPS
jgi:hypothetical protein